jgi:LysM repeat protein
MNDSLDKEIDRSREEIADDLGYKGKSKTARRHRSFFPFKSKRNVLILAGAGIILLLIFVALFSGNGNERVANNLLVIRARLDLLEKRIKYLEGMESNPLITETAKTEGPLAQQLQNLAKRLDRLEEIIVATPLTTREKLWPPKKGRYHEVRSGDTLYRIASTYGLTVDELCRLNKIGPRQIIYPGQKLLVASEGMQ